MEHGVLLFFTTSAVMRAEKILAKAGLQVKPIPIPRQFSSDCGISIRFDWQDLIQVKSLIESNRVDLDAIHKL